jgi:predicted GNAT family acetyltransferase
MAESMTGNPGDTSGNPGDGNPGDVTDNPGKMRYEIREGGEEAGFVSYAREGKVILPYCPFMRSWMAEHPEYTDLVPEQQRAEFGL